MREYSVVRDILEDMKIASIQLLTNNPRKVQAMEELGLTVTERIAIKTPHNPHNQKYLATKTDKLGHIMG